MQLIALDENRRLIHASQALRQQAYSCLECGSEVRLRGGKQRQLHFFHMEPNRICLQNQKGPIHIYVQHFLYENLPTGDCQLEYRFPQIARIADAIWISKKIVFEIQYSPISPAEVKARNEDYRKIGWEVVWILHEHHFNQYLITSAEEELRTHTHYFCSFNALGKGGIYDQYQWIEEGKRKIRLDPLPINIRAPQKMALGQHFDNYLLKKKRAAWKYYFENDLTHLFINDPKDAYIQKVLEIEAATKKSHFKIFVDTLSSFYNTLKSYYKQIFRYFIEKTCR